MTRVHFFDPETELRLKHKEWQTSVCLFFCSNLSNFYQQDYLEIIK
jgi:hypothetical protein